MTIQSLADLPGATPQEIFDQAAAHLLRQKAKSLFYRHNWWDLEEPEPEHGTPTWATPGGHRCAVGHFMTQEDLQTAIARNWVCPRELPIWESLNGSQQAVLSGLQGIHDDFPVEAWADLLHELATSLGLSPACIPT